MDKKIIQKAFKENNFKLLEEQYKKEEIEKIPHKIISEQLKITNGLELCHWLFQNGIDYNAKDELGNTGLMISCYMKNKEFVKLYLSYNADVNINNEITALMLSLEGLVDETIVDLLLKHNPDVDIIIKYNKEEISAISLAYFNVKSLLFKELVSRSNNILKHIEIINKLRKSNIKEAKTKLHILEKKKEEEINKIYKKEPLKTLTPLIKKYNLTETINKIIFNDKNLKTTCINKKTNEYEYTNDDSTLKILYKKDKDTKEITFIDILLNEEIIYPELKKERENKEKELNEKRKKYNDSFKLDIGYKRELDIKKEKTIKKEKNKEIKENSINKKIKTANSSKYNYLIEYADENKFRKIERGVKKYNMLGYKKLMFEYYPKLRNGNLLGNEISKNKKDKTINYELPIPTEKIFEKIHGTIKLHYKVDLDKKIILLETITPEALLTEAHSYELSTYKGVMISKTNPNKDIFKINLLNNIKK